MIGISVRGGITPTPEASEFTSIYERIKALKSKEEKPSPSISLPSLHPFRDVVPSSLSISIPFTLKDYLELLDFTGKYITNPKKASISKKLPSILNRLNIDPTTWASPRRPSGNLFGRAIGKFDRLRTHAWNLNKDWIHGLGLSKRMFGTE